VALLDLGVNAVPVVGGKGKAGEGGHGGGGGSRPEEVASVHWHAREFTTPSFLNTFVEILFSPSKS
jgi:hypothetical protein